MSALFPAGKAIPAPARRRHRIRAGLVAGAALLSVLAPAAAAAAAPAAPSAIGYTFSTIDNPADPTFNQLLGINDKNVIAGYYGSGADAMHPNKGYTVKPPYTTGSFTPENVPGSAQTQVVAITNKHNTAGFWVDSRGNNYGFVQWHGVFATVVDPHTKGSTKVNQVLGLNDAGTAVGFYNDAAGNSHGYEYHQGTGTFSPVTVPGAVSTVATGINANGDVTGFFFDGAGNAHGFLRKAGHLTTFDDPKGSNTEPFGINRSDQIVGSYTDGAGTMHGFLLSSPTGARSTWRTIDDPNGVGNTLVNGINTAGNLVGFYVDTAGNTHGFLAKH